MRLLIAEDDIVSRRVLERLLSEWGYETIVAADGNEAWQLIEQGDPPPLVILDWMMPGIDGVEVCRRLRQRDYAINPYVILLTGKDRKEDLLEGFEAGVDDYVAKPFDPEELKVRTRAGQRIVNLQIEAAAALSSLRKQASHDSLTGLLNRAAIMDEIGREFARAPRSGSGAIGIVMIDLDHFKDINDSFGHHIGDRVLTEAARRLAGVVRSYEAIGRYGGEEFVLVLADCDEEGAARVAERLRRSLSDREFDIPGSSIPVSASFGVSSSAGIDVPSEAALIELADSALYLAKRNGRNRVERASDVRTGEARTCPAPTAAKV